MLSNLLGHTCLPSKEVEFVTGLPDRLMAGMVTDSKTVVASLKLRSETVGGSSNA